MSAATATRPPATAQRLRLTTTVRIELDIDIAGWFLAMNKSQQAAYLAWDPALDENINEEVTDWQRPFEYLLCDQYEAIEVCTGAGGLAWARDFTDVEWWDRPKWTEQDYTLLLAAVPWLAASIEVDDDTRAEMARVQPSPWDVPLFGDEVQA